AGETATFYLREFSEPEMLERRLRLGAAAARRLDEEEKAKAEKIVHPIPREFRGIGVRIEDDVLITADGHDVLTVGVPKTIDEVGRVRAEAPPPPRWRRSSPSTSTARWSTCGAALAPHSQTS